VNRRQFFAIALAGALAASFRVEAQQGGKLWRIGFLGDGSPSSRAAQTIEPLREGLRELGYSEKRNLVIEARWSDGMSERHAELARELVALRLDLIVTHGIPAVLALKAATRTIPIVVAVAADLVGTGVVTSLSRPGGNVTGFSDLVPDLGGKELEILQEIIPRLRRVAVLWNRANPGAVNSSRAVQKAVRDARLRLEPLEISSPDEIGPALEAAAKLHMDALIIVHDTMTNEHRHRIARLAADKRLPSISASALFADAGGLINYGPDQAELFRRSALFVDKIFKGAKPGDLPVEQPTKFQLAINLKTAKALRVTIPPSLLLRADRVIQ
jgi:putative tryptophan/tyrosine transport system substrate-binding protein